MKYNYLISYDSETDEFYAWVFDQANKDGDSKYTIESTEEICDLIKCGKMTHIDDADGLGKYLKDEGIIRPEDEVFMSEHIQW